MAEWAAALEIALKAQDDEAESMYEFKRGFMFGFCAARGASAPRRDDEPQKVDNP